MYVIMTWILRNVSIYVMYIMSAALSDRKSFVVVSLLTDDEEETVVDSKDVPDSACKFRADLACKFRAILCTFDSLQLRGNVHSSWPMITWCILSCPVMAIAAWK